jgi:hypothetical protein
MRGFIYIGSLVVALFVATSVHANPTSVTTCTENALGDQSCTTVTTTTTNTPGTTTGNVLTNSTFGTGTDPNETTTTTGWSGDEHLHTHGMFGQNMGNPQSGQDITGGVYAFQGDPADNVYQDTDLVGDGHLTKSQINEGFTSTQSADIWFWNNLKNTLTIKQTITDSDGNVTTQTRVIVDHDPTRSMNGGSWSNETNVYTHSSNTADDITIRAEMYNDTDGTTYDNYHRGPDVDNFELSITTAGSTSSSSTSSTVVTLCADRVPPTCTTAGDDVADAIEEIGDAVTGDDGQSIDQSIETIVENEIINVNPVIEEEVYIVQTVIAVEDDFGAVEELTVQDFVQESFTAIIEDEGLQEEFQDALSDEGITEQEFFEAVANEMEQEFAESGVENITSTNTDPLPVIEEAPIEETAVEETAVEETVVEEAPTETETVNTTEESLETESETTATETETETNTEPENTESETNTSSEASETGNEEATTETQTEENATESNETTETESANEEESSGDVEESVEDQDGESTSAEDSNADASVSGDVDGEVSEISKKVERIIKKLESKLKTLDQKLKVISIVTAKAMIDEQPDMTQYTNQQFYDTRKMPDNPDWYAKDTILDAYGRSIYQDKTLVAYQTNDPIFQHNEQVNKVNNDISRLEAELEVLKNENN